MGLNSLTYPLHYEDAKPKTDLNSTLHINRTEETASSRTGFEAIVGKSSVLRRVLQMVETVAGGDSTVLLLGETGTGKELIARAIHGRSPRNARPFVKLNCAAIPTGLLESELFGHERGSFTGAIAQKIGRLEVAHQGSLFLDEIGDIPLELQPKLLRALQEREFERLGSTRTQKVDVRIVAATHRDLEGMILEKQFRSDLYYRLNVFPIRVPPLRERPEDISLLVQHFVQQTTRRMQKTIDTIPSETMDALIDYRWPGNIRELENVIERAVILSPGRVLRLSLRDLKSRIASGQDTDHHQTLKEVERNHILRILNETRWIVSGPSGAASRLGLNRSTLYFRMKKLGIARSVDSL
jgi:formate hydrogenlyase transcriptional activator